MTPIIVGSFMGPAEADAARQMALVLGIAAHFCSMGRKDGGRP